MKIERHFTIEGIHPFEEVNWKLCSSQINDKDGKVIFKQDNVEFPEFWEQNDIDITVDKYFAGAVNSKNREHSLKQTITRIVEWYSEKGNKDGYFSSQKDCDIFKDELTYLLLHQYGVFNSPVLFNVGVQKDPQVSACFIMSAEDTMESISENMKIEMDIFRRGSGAGTNHSNLRSSKETVSTGGYAMGPLPVMKISDKIAGATKSGGKTRRAALMKELDIDHGDIEDFITQKAEVERAAKALIKAGWSSHFDDSKGAYGLLGLQNFNESVSTFNSFMESINPNEEWALIERKESKNITSFKEVKHTLQGMFVSKVNDDNVLYKMKDDKFYKVIKWVKAKDLWNLICESAWECADPGLQFYDTINKWNTCKNDGDIKGSNPCSEYFFLEDTSCNLASLNLLQFLNEDGSFNTKRYIKAITIFIIAMDISVHNALYPTKKIANITKQYRTLGLGYCNVGTILLHKAIPYSSEEGRRFIGALTALLLAGAYNASSTLAKELGAFERYEDNKQHVVNVLKLHKEAMESFLNSSTANSEIHSMLLEANSIFPNIQSPVRNAQTTLIAPTGTIAFWLGAETTGLEPFLGTTIYKKMVGGGFLKLTSPSVKKALEILKYSENDIFIILKQIDEKGYALENPLKKEHLPIFETSFGKSNTLSPIAHVKMMAYVQPFISGAISKTVNLPNNATVQDISDIYYTAWTSGLKCISVYRDDCKGSQPLSTQKDSSHKGNGRPIPVRKRLPKDYPSHGHEFQIGNQKGFLNLGFYPDTKELGATFITISKAGSTLNGFMNAIAILISHMLQYKIPTEEVINTLKNLQFEPGGFTDNPEIRTATSIPDYIAKYIEIYLSRTSNKIEEELKEEETTNDYPKLLEGTYGPPCIECGQLTVKSGTCFRCLNCGSTTGCS